MPPICDFPVGVGGTHLTGLKRYVPPICNFVMGAGGGGGGGEGSSLNWPKPVCVGVLISAANLQFSSGG